MTAKEMQRRNGKAQQLRVIQVEEGHYFVESSDGKVAYKAMLTDEKTFCTCLDYQKNQQRSRLPVQAPAGDPELPAGGLGPEEGFPEEAPAQVG